MSKKKGAGVPGSIEPGDSGTAPRRNPPALRASPLFQRGVRRSGVINPQSGRQSEAVAQLGNVEHLVSVVFPTSGWGERLAVLLVQLNCFVHDLA